MIFKKEKSLLVVVMSKHIENELYTIGPSTEIGKRYWISFHYNKCKVITLYADTDLYNKLNVGSCYNIQYKDRELLSARLAHVDKT